jgi:hypothetical protein
MIVSADYSNGGLLELASAITFSLYEANLENSEIQISWRSALRESRELRVIMK